MAEEELNALKPKAVPLMWDAGTRFQAELKRKLSGKRSGRTYRSSRTGALHVASAPGEPPAVLFGALRNSMGFSRPKWRNFVLEMEVGSGLGAGQDKDDSKVRGYARRLEFGGISFHPWPVKIEARPYMAPTALKMDPILQRLFEARL
jgi:hypothetical protein